MLLDLDVRYVPNVTEQFFRIVNSEKAQHTKNLAIKNEILGYLYQLQRYALFSDIQFTVVTDVLA